MAFNWDGRMDYREKKSGKEYEGSNPPLRYAVMEMKVKVRVDFGLSHNGGITHTGNVLQHGELVPHQRMTPCQIPRSRLDKAYLSLPAGESLSTIRGKIIADIFTWPSLSCLSGFLAILLCSYYVTFRL